MEILDQLLTKTIDLVPTAVILVAAIIIIWIVRYILNKRFAGAAGHQFRIQIITLLLSFIGLLVVILTLPLSESTIGQLLGLLGILLSAAIALSATTFVGNIMAGLMLRAIRNFRAGDFVRVGDHFGRVSERGLFHIEIQTEDSDLTTLPNLYLITNPVKVIRSGGTLISAEVSLGYDIPRTRVEDTLLTAAADAGLGDPFVHIIDLGNYSITYRLAGLLTEVKSLLSTRSKIRAKMLDHLHRAGIEIVSPTFMNQRILDTDKNFIPKDMRKTMTADKKEGIAEAVAFDKADEAESQENLRERQTKLREEIETLKSSLSDIPDETTRNKKRDEIAALEARLARLIDYIAQRENGEKK
jgi:small-conductance mechanosensitive channel